MFRSYISESAIQAILDSLLPNATPSINNAKNLANLAMVEERLATPEYPRSENERLHILQEIIVDYVSQEYNRHRAIYDLPQIAQEDLNRKECAEIIDADNRAESPQLRCWGWYYYHYVRSELELSLADYAGMCNVSKRTIRRCRESQQLTQLTTLMIEDEAEARSRTRNRYLYAQILGDQRRFHNAIRKTELDDCLGYIQNNNFPIVFVTGVPGVGKTTFVRQVVKQLFEQDEYDDLAFISQNEDNHQTLLHKIHLSLDLPPATKLSTFCSLYKNLIIIDDIPHKLWSEIDDILTPLREAHVILISDRYVPIQFEHHHIKIRELSYTQTIEYLEFRQQQKPNSQADTSDLGEAFNHSIWEKVGGNLRAIEYLLQNPMIMTDTDNRAVSILQSVYTRIFGDFDEKSLISWLFLSVMQGYQVNINALVQYFPDFSHHLDGFVNAHLIDVTSLAPLHYTIPASVKRYEQVILTESTVYKQAIESWRQAGVILGEERPQRYDLHHRTMFTFTPLPHEIEYACRNSRKHSKPFN